MMETSVEGGIHIKGGERRKAKGRPLKLQNGMCAVITFMHLQTMYRVPIRDIEVVYEVYRHNHF